MDRRVWIQVALCSLYVMDVVAIPVSHLNFWALTIVFAGASFEAGVGISIYRHFGINRRLGGLGLPKRLSVTLRRRA
jgi:hypothetical protein